MKNIFGVSNVTADINGHVIEDAAEYVGSVLDVFFGRKGLFSGIGKKIDDKTKNLWFGIRW